jgi:hypothetical protein
MAITVFLTALPEVAVTVIVAPPFGVEEGTCAVVQPTMPPAVINKSANVA